MSSLHEHAIKEQVHVKLVVCNRATVLTIDLQTLLVYLDLLTPLILTKVSNVFFKKLINLIIQYQ